MEDRKDKKSGAKARPSKLKSGKRLLIHMALIGVVVVVGAIVAHFSLVIFTRHGAHCTVPQFKGLALHEAQYMAQQSELNIIINDSLYAPMHEPGVVLDQLPKAGVGVKPGRSIYVTINAFGVKMVSVPYVAGRSLRQAKNMLEVAGLQIERLEYKPDMATNYVLAQYCGSQEITDSMSYNVAIGSGVVLHVGSGNEGRTAVMPQLIGMTLREAKSRLWESGLNVGRVVMPDGGAAYTHDKARVYAQSVAKGASVSLGCSIAIDLTMDRDMVDEVLKQIASMERAAEIMRQREEDSLARARIMNLSQEAVQLEESGVVEQSADSFFE